MRYLYAAYGSNMNLEQMAFRCPKAKKLGVGIMQGYKLYFDFHANIYYTGNNLDIIPVVIWEINDADDWNNLDIYEGYPKYYVKHSIPICFEGELKHCVVYVMNTETTEYIMPEITYLKTIYDGYTSNNIDTKYLMEAVIEVLNNDEYGGKYYKQ